MTRRVSKGQERLWGEDTVSLGRATEAEHETPESIRAPLAHPPRRPPRRALAGCAAVLVVVAITILALGDEKHRSTLPPIKTPAAQATRRSEVLQAPKTPSAARPHRHRRPSRPEHHRKHHAEPAPELEAPLPPTSVEVEPETEAAPPPPTSPTDSPPAPQPTPATTEFGIERTSG